MFLCNWWNRPSVSLENGLVKSICHMNIAKRKQIFSYECE